MKTLYELLGALPDDDAEDIRAAFRKAVKAAHPDINPGDPDAAIKFRQIVRANEILVDQEQRAVYDHLLDLARIEQEAASKQAVAAAVHKVASGTMALAGLSAVAIGGYLLIAQLSATPIGPSVELSFEPWAQVIRKTSHSIAEVLARPSFAVAHKPMPPVKAEDTSEVADAGPTAAATPLGDAGHQAAAADHHAPAPAAASDPWDDRNDGSNGAIAYLELAPKYPAPHIESTIAPFGFGQSVPAPKVSAPSSAAQSNPDSGTPNNGASNNAAANASAPNAGVQNTDARNSNAQNSIPANSPVPSTVPTPKHGERTGNSAPKSFRMPPPHAEIPMMPEPRPRLTAAQDMSRQESGGPSVVR